MDVKPEVQSLLDTKTLWDDWSTTEVVALETEAIVLLSRAGLDTDTAALLVGSISHASFIRGYDSRNRSS